MNRVIMVPVGLINFLVPLHLKFQLLSEDIKLEMIS